MLAEPEHYKGIDFVRLSTLPGEQKSKIRESYHREGIVKIIKDNSLINDCIIYSDYVNWYKQHRFSKIPSAKKESNNQPELELSELAES
jgi:hypothetical protein